MEIVTSLKEAEYWFLSNSSDNVICKSGNEEKTCESYLEAKKFFDFVEGDKMIPAIEEVKDRLNTLLDDGHQEVISNLLLLSIPVSKSLADHKYVVCPATDDRLSVFGLINGLVSKDDATGKNQRLAAHMHENKITGFEVKSFLGRE